MRMLSTGARLSSSTSVIFVGLDCHLNIFGDQAMEIHSIKIGIVILSVVSLLIKIKQEENYDLNEKNTFLGIIILKIN